MRNGRTWRIVRHCLGALAFSLALAGSSIAGALTVDASSYSANWSPFFFPTCQVKWCAWSASALGGTNTLVLTSISRFETPIKWQSSFSIAGSRVWSKFINASRSGLNVRLPLN
jgi:hypothetical protein